VTPRKFLPDETQGEFLPVESSVDFSVESSVDFSVESSVEFSTEESPGELLTEETTENEIGSGEMW